MSDGKHQFVGEAVLRPFVELWAVHLEDYQRVVVAAVVEVSVAVVAAVAGQITGKKKRSRS